jgi:hypothetical protein
MVRFNNKCGSPSPALSERSSDDGGKAKLFLAEAAEIGQHLLAVPLRAL